MARRLFLLQASSGLAHARVGGIVTPGRGRGGTRDRGSRREVAILAGRLEVLAVAARVVQDFDALDGLREVRGEEGGGRRGREGKGEEGEEGKEGGEGEDKPESKQNPS
jgi:hypothetical protein